MTFAGDIAFEVYKDIVAVFIYFTAGCALLVGLDRLVHLVWYFYYHLKTVVLRKQPEDNYGFADLTAGGLGKGSEADDWVVNSDLPRVAVQLPMYNERYVCKTAIDRACELRWPRDRLLIQVLDDSTDAFSRQIVDDTVMEWMEQGVQITVQRRKDRSGYKAGSLKKATEKLSPEYEYIAIFDADFEPDADLLIKMVPYLMANDKISFVQARWEFKNPYQTLLTRSQLVNLNYHGKGEQWVRFSMGSFVQFHGTAGIWSHKCIREVGGWMSRSTVEDMDLALRSYYAGWRAIFLRDVTCLNELPASLAAYRKQQHRWTTGPMQLWVMTFDSLFKSALSVKEKLEVFLGFFVLHTITPNFVNLPLYCILLPICALTPSVVPGWVDEGPYWLCTPKVFVLMWLPIVISLTCAFFTRPWGLLIAPINVLFENAMGAVKLKAIIVGLLGTKSAGEWVVTLKLGAGEQSKAKKKATGQKMWQCYLQELTIGVFMLYSAFHGMFFHRLWLLPGYLIAQGAVFILFGTNMVDCNGLLEHQWDFGWVCFSTTSDRVTLPDVEMDPTKSKPAVLAAATAGADQIPMPLTKTDLQHILDTRSDSETSSDEDEEAQAIRRKLGGEFEMANMDPRSSSGSETSAGGSSSANRRMDGSIVKEVPYLAQLNLTEAELSPFVKVPVNNALYRTKSNSDTSHHSRTGSGSGGSFTRSQSADIPNAAMYHGHEASSSSGSIASRPHLHNNALVSHEYGQYSSEDDLQRTGETVIVVDEGSDMDETYGSPAGPQQPRQGPVGLAGPAGAPRHY